MDKAEVKYLQDALVVEFAKLQKSIDDFALDRIPTKRVVRIGGTEHQIYRDHWIFEVVRLSFSPEFLNLAGHFDHYRLRLLPEGDSYLERLFDKSHIIPLGPDEKYPEEKTCADWRDLDWDFLDEYELDPRELFSAFENWCSASGFFYRKLVDIDRSDWTSSFRELLEKMEKEMGLVDCMLCIPYVPIDLRPKSISTRNISKPDVERVLWLCQSEQILTEYPSEESFVSHSWTEKTKPEILTGTALVKTIKCSDYARGGQPNLFINERAVFELCLRKRLPLRFQSALSRTLLEPIYYFHPIENSSNVRCTDSPLASLFDNEPDEQLHDESGERLYERWFGRLFDSLIELVSNKSVMDSGLHNALLIFENASTASDQLVEFLLYVTCLEATLAGKTSVGIGDKIAERYSKIIGQEDCVRSQLCESAKAIYRRRNDILHGNDPSIVRTPFKDEKERRELRAMCRRSLLTMIFVLSQLKLDRSSSAPSELHRFFKGRIPRTRDQLCSSMGEFEANDEYWRALYHTASAYSARVGFPLPELLKC